MTAFARRMRPAPALRLTAPISSADTIGQRAANIVHMLGLSGDPVAIERHFNVVADMLEAYAAADKEAAGKRGK